MRMVHSPKTLDPLQEPQGNRILFILVNRMHHLLPANHRYENGGKMAVSIDSLCCTLRSSNLGDRLDTDTLVPLVLSLLPRCLSADS